MVQSVSIVFLSQDYDSLQIIAMTAAIEDKSKDTINGRNC